jgi:HEAT repeat protein
VSELGPTRFLDEADDAAVVAADEMIGRGRDAEFAGFVLEQLSREESWIRDRVIRRLPRLQASERLLPFFRDALSDGMNADQRNAARSALAGLAQPRSTSSRAALDLLAELLISPDTDVRLLATITLGEAGNPRGREPLEAAIRDPDPNVSAAAAESLGLLGDCRAVEALAAAVTGASPWARIAAILALGRLADPHGLPTLERAVRDPLLRAAAVTALGEMGTPATLNALRESLETGGDTRELAMTAAARVFGRNPGLEVPDWLRAAIAGEAESLADRFTSIPDDATARLLGITGTSEAARILFDAVEDPARRADAVVGLELLPDALLGPLALSRLHTTSREIRPLILDLLPPLDDHTSIDLVCEELGSGDPAARAAAAAALARSDTSLVRPALQRALRKPDFRAGVAQTYGRMRADQCDAIRPLLDDPLPEVREAAAFGVGRCGGEGIDAVEVALDRESEPRVRQALFTALGDLGGDRVVMRLSRAAAADPDPGIRFAAIRALGRSGSVRAIEPLLSTLDDPRPELRIAALHALGELGEVSASTAIQEHMDEASDEVRRTAAHALRQVPGPGAADRLIRALGDDDPEVRLTAAEVLTTVGGAEALRALEDRADTESEHPVLTALTRAIMALRSSQRQGAR